MEKVRALSIKSFTKTQLVTVGAAALALGVLAYSLFWHLLVSNRDWYKKLSVAPECSLRNDVRADAEEPVFFVTCSGFMQ